jgi:amidophosphoribosyltransferase
LIANNLNIEQICQRIGADSLAYLSLPGLFTAIERATENAGGFCSACFSGEYPIPIPEWLLEDDRDKMLFESVWG